MPGIELGSDRKFKKTDTLPSRSSESKDKTEMQETVKHGEEYLLYSCVQAC